MPKSIAHQVTALYEILQHEFALLPTGRQLPAYRALLKKYGCSRQTLSRTLQLLIENGVIYSEERSGIFASGKFTSDLYRILFIRVDWCCEHADRFSEAIRQEISKRRNFHYIELRYPPQNCDSFLEQIDKSSADLLILWPEELSFTSLQRLSSLQLPLILFDSGIMLPNAAILDIQEELAGMMAAKYLVNRGHRRIALAITEPKGLTCRKKINGFMDYLYLAGIVPHVIDIELSGGEASQSASYEFFTYWLQRNRVDFSACFVLSDYTALGVIRAFQDTGYQVPKDISIIGCQGEMAGERSQPTLTTIIFDAEKVATVLATGIDEVFAGGTFGIRRIPPILIERNSVISLPLVKASPPSG